MIFKFFKRSSPPAPAKPAPRRVTKKKSIDRADLPTEPSQLPEVVEGSEHTDWALWEDSVAALDSQMHSLNPQVVKRFLPDETPTDFQPVEAFARVKKKDP